ncbi:hypothetical protein JB92DRAFT_2856829 [Gautieria morchelliformis]|nr:hypothetical protein JB92DRAFT_2856829 [Gautieria morchelliformis]
MLLLSLHVFIFSIISISPCNASPISPWRLMLASLIWLRTAGWLVLPMLEWLDGVVTSWDGVLPSNLDIHRLYSDMSTSTMVYQ